MDAQRLLDISPAIVLPIVLGACLICGIAGIFVVATTPEGLDPIEGLGLRVYLLQNDDVLHSPAGENPDSKRFEILPGESANDIGIKLVTEGLISNGSLFARYARFEGLDDDLRPGVFRISQTMTIPQILTVLTNPTPTTIEFLIREDYRLEQIAESIDNTSLLEFTGDEFIALVETGASIPEEFRLKYGIPDGSSLEGFLYPATYTLEVTTTAVEFRDLLLATFERNVTQELLDEAMRQGRTMHQVVTVASIVEKEAVLEDERSIIASVYLNRLAIGQKLDADPTVQYQMATNRQDGIWWPQLVVSDYTNVVGPYNTYLNNGLPPGPIVNPAVRSIRAVLFPADTNYIYFQLSCDGGGKHEFFDTPEAHDAYYQFRLNGCQ
jgi:UPF0755 protein